MASRALDDCDGVYTDSSQNLDEVDAAYVFHRTQVDQLPPRYKRESAQIASWQQIKTSRPRMVHSSWGNRLTHEVTCNGLHALLHVKGEELTEENAKILAQRIEDASAAIEIQVARWHKNYLLCRMPSVACYEALKQTLEQGQIQPAKNEYISELEGAVLCNPPKTYFELSLLQGEELRQSLVDVVLPFSSAFTFLELIQDPELQVQATPQHPAPCLTLLFEGTNHKHAQRTLRVLSQSPWQPLPLDPKIMNDLDSGLGYYRNSLGGPLVGVRTGCPQAGVQLTLFLRDQAQFDAMVQFYQGLTGVTPLSKISTNLGACYRVFPVSERGELMILYVPGFKPDVMPSIHVYIDTQKEASDLDKMATRMTEDRWRTQDPEGNTVCLFRPLR